MCQLPLPCPVDGWHFETIEITGLPHHPACIFRLASSSISFPLSNAARLGDDTMTRPGWRHHETSVWHSMALASGTYMAASKSTSFKRPSEVRSKFSGFRSRWATRLERKYLPVALTGICLAKIGSRDFMGVQRSHNSTRTKFWIVHLP